MRKLDASIRPRAAVETVGERLVNGAPCGNSMKLGLVFSCFVGVALPSRAASADDSTLAHEVPQEKSSPAQAKPLNCSKGFLSLRTPPPACKARRQLEYALLPAVFAQKETGFGFVLYNELSFFSDDKPATHASRAGLALTITTQKQFIGRIPTVLSFDNNDWVVDGYADFRIYPNRYYGEGNSADWNYQAYSETVLNFNYELRRRIKGPFYAGLLWNLRTAFDMNSKGYFDKKGTALKSLPPDDSDDADVQLGPYINHGLGLQAAYDTRDDFSYPTRGGYHRTSLQGFAKFLGGDYDYLLWTVDARQYIPTWTNQILALQVLSEVRKGVMPFTVMSEVGGPFAMRGYYRGRYRAGDMLLIQAEYRFPIYRRLTGVGFGNFGEVYGVESPFRFDRLRWTLGAGMRFRFGEHTYVRFDMGGNHETYAGIFNGGQAF
jgi:hypothetical protein